MFGDPPIQEATKQKCIKIWMLGSTPKEAARLCKISVNCTYQLIAKYEETHDTASRPQDVVKRGRLMPRDLMEQWDYLHWRYNTINNKIKI